ncbi:Yip1 family protein [Streptomyces ficellus]|uniref:YIP1 family protein n=1 Tax=Streptomyces ficellus TaxID=1977088 RepID=A0A6I6F8S8_9ACTN|nr:Yip1 family protein [Streptomyces ficellus]QGV79441.1 YIP1 family protein [Streptomyces ficellus]
MAGFRIGRGRSNRTPQQQPQQAPYGGPAAPPPYGQPQARWPQGQQAYPQGQQQPYGEPEYFGDPYAQAHPAPPHDPYAANNPGHTRAFSIHDEAYAGDGAPYEGGGTTYQAGATHAPAGPRLHWKQLLNGIVMRPGPTFFQMRDHAVWGPALVITFLYGLLALFGFDQAREDAINATLSTAVPYVLVTGAMFVVGGLILGAVTHTLARQLGGDGAWQPTVGLSMLIMSMTDAPRLLFALFLGGENTFVQIVGWLSWLAAAALFTSMVSKSHDLPWPKALGASAIQLVALLSLLKLGTI